VPASPPNGLEPSGAGPPKSGSIAVAQAINNREAFATKNQAACFNLRCTVSLPFEPIVGQTRSVPCQCSAPLRPLKIDIPFSYTDALKTPSIPTLGAASRGSSAAENSVAITISIRLERTRTCDGSSAFDAGAWR